MIAILITEKKYMTIDLPDKCSGKYWFLDDELPLGRQRVLGIEAIARFSFFVLAALFIAAIFFVYCLAPVYDPGNIQPLSTSNNSITTA